MGSDLPDFVLEAAAWLITYALHSSALLLAALVVFAGIGRAARRSQPLADAAPAWRERIGRVALLGGIATASAQAALGIEPFGLRPALVDVSPVAASDARVPVAVPELLASTPRSTTVTAATPPSSSESDSSPAELPVVPLSLWPAVIALRHAAEFAIPGKAASPSTDQPVPAVPETAGERQVTWIAAFIALWGLVAGASFVRRYCGWRALRASLDGAEPVTDPDVLATFDRLLLRAGLRREGARGVRLFVAPLLVAPVTRGVLRREVHVPPRALEDLDEDELAALFGHEVAHARRDDPAWLLAYRALEVVFCLQPLNRVVARRLEDDAELLCDDRAVVWTGGRLPLASCLTEVASWLVPDRATPRWAAPMAAHGARLSRRVERLVDESHALDAGRRRPLLTAGAVALAASAVAVVPGFAAQRGAKALPPELALELWLATSASEPITGATVAESSETLDAGAPVSLPEPEATTIAMPAIQPTIDVASRPLAPATTPPETTALGTVLDELERELVDLRLALDQREGGTNLLPDVDALARRVEALRSREAALSALLAASASDVLSPAPTGPTAEDR